MHGIIYGRNIKSFETTWKTSNTREIGLNLRNANDLTLPTPNFEGYNKFP